MGSKKVSKPETWQEAMNGIIQGVIGRLERIEKAVRQNPAGEGVTLNALAQEAAAAGKELKVNFIPSDPWAHRSDGMKCKTCMWFVPKSGDKPAYDLGRCRRHAPTMNGYPVVFVNDWCGDHKVDENKI